MTGGPKAAALAIFLVMLLAATGCGQMGPLTLPDDVVDDNLDEDGDDANER